MAHEKELRVELSNLDKSQLDALCTALKTDWRHARLEEQNLALCAYAEKLTRTPAAMTEADVKGLRAVNFDDVAIHDAIQVIAYFNYINRVADAVHVELEPEMGTYPGEEVDG